MKIWNKHFIIFLIMNTAIFLSFNMSTAGFPAYVSSYGSSYLTTGLVTSVSAVAALLLRPVAGYLVDYRDGKCFLLVGLACLASPFFCLFSSNAEMILIVRFLQGAGWGLASTVCSKTIANTLPHERISEGIGYAGFLSSVAAAFAPSFAISISGKMGFNLMFVFIGICPIIAIIFSIISRHNKKEDVESKGEKEHSFIVLSFEAFVPAFLIMTITMAYAPMVTFIIPYTQTIGVSGTKEFFFAYACATTISRPLTGFYVDRKNTYSPTVMALLCVVVASVLLFSCRSSSLLIIAGVFAGIGTGVGMNALQTLAVKKVTRTKRGMAMAIFLFGFDLGMAVGSLIAGIISSSIGFKQMFIIMSFPSLLACIVLVVTTIRKRKILHIR